MDNFPMAVCHTAKEYIEVAFALETLAYHNKNYLASMMGNDARENEEIRLLLFEALKKISEGE